VARFNLGQKNIPREDRGLEERGAPMGVEGGGLSGPQSPLFLRGGGGVSPRHVLVTKPANRGGSGGGGVARRKTFFVSLLFSWQTF